MTWVVQGYYQIAEKPGTITGARLFCYELLSDPFSDRTTIRVNELY